MRTYLPGFLFRGLLVLAVFLVPVLAVLLWPAALLSLALPRPLPLRVLWAALGWLPLAILLAGGIEGLAGEIVCLSCGFQGGAASAVLIPATLAAYAISTLRARRAPSLPGSGPREPVPQARSAGPER